MVTLKSSDYGYKALSCSHVLREVSKGKTNSLSPREAMRWTKWQQQKIFTAKQAVGTQNVSRHLATQTRRSSRIKSSFLTPTNAPLCAQAQSHIASFTRNTKHIMERQGQCRVEGKVDVSLQRKTFKYNHIQLLTTFNEIAITILLFYSF